MSKRVCSQCGYRFLPHERAHYKPRVGKLCEECIARNRLTDYPARPNSPAQTESFKPVDLPDSSDLPWQSQKV